MRLTCPDKSRVRKDKIISVFLYLFFTKGRLTSNAVRVPSFIYIQKLKEIKTKHSLLRNERAVSGNLKKYK